MVSSKASPGVETWHCRPCDIHFTSSGEYNVHVKSSGHRQKVIELAHAPKKETVDGGPQKQSQVGATKSGTSKPTPAGRGSRPQIQPQVGGLKLGTSKPGLAGRGSGPQKQPQVGATKPGTSKPGLAGRGSGPQKQLQVGATKPGTSKPGLAGRGSGPQKQPQVGVTKPGTSKPGLAGRGSAPQKQLQVGVTKPGTSTPGPAGNGSSPQKQPEVTKTESSTPALAGSSPQKQPEVMKTESFTPALAGSSPHKQPEVTKTESSTPAPAGSSPHKQPEVTKTESSTSNPVGLGGSLQKQPLSEEKENNSECNGPDQKESEPSESKDSATAVASRGLSDQPSLAPGTNGTAVPLTAPRETLIDASGPKEKEEQEGSDEGSEVQDEDQMDREETVMDVDVEEGKAKEAHGPRFCEICNLKLPKFLDMKAHNMYEDHHQNKATHELQKQLARMDSTVIGPILPPIIDFVEMEKRITSRTLDLKERVDSCSDSLLGLECVVEYQYTDRYAESDYECIYCDSVMDARQILPHVAGLQHRRRYIRYHCPDGIRMVSMAFAAKRKNFTNLIKSLSKDIEKREGRKDPNIRVQVPKVLMEHWESLGVADVVKARGEFWKEIGKPGTTQGLLSKEERDVKDKEEQDIWKVNATKVKAKEGDKEKTSEQNTNKASNKENTEVKEWLPAKFKGTASDPVVIEVESKKSESSTRGPDTSKRRSPNKNPERSRELSKRRSRSRELGRRRSRSRESGRRRSRSRESGRRRSRSRESGRRRSRSKELSKRRSRSRELSKRRSRSKERMRRRSRDRSPRSWGRGRDRPSHIRSGSQERSSHKDNITRDGNRSHSREGSLDRLRRLIREKSIERERQRLRSRERSLERLKNQIKARKKQSKSSSKSGSSSGDSSSEEGSINTLISRTRNKEKQVAEPTHRQDGRSPSIEKGSAEKEWVERGPGRQRPQSPKECDYRGRPSDRERPRPDSRYDPYGRDPHARDPYSRDPYGPDPYTRDPYARDPYSRDPYPRDPYSRDPYPRDPYSRDPYSRDLYSRDPYLQDLYNTRDYRPDRYHGDPYATDPYRADPYRRERDPYAPDPYSRPLPTSESKDHSKPAAESNTTNAVDAIEGYLEEFKLMKAGQEKTGGAEPLLPAFTTMSNKPFEHDEQTRAESKLKTASTMMIRLKTLGSRILAKLRETMSGMMSEADMAAQVSKLLAKAVLDSGIDVSEVDLAAVQQPSRSTSKAQLQEQWPEEKQHAIASEEFWSGVSEQADHRLGSSHQSETDNKSAEYGQQDWQHQHGYDQQRPEGYDQQQTQQEQKDFGAQTQTEAEKPKNLSTTELKSYITKLFQGESEHSPAGREPIAEYTTSAASQGYNYQYGANEGSSPPAKRRALDDDSHDYLYSTECSQTQASMTSSFSQPTSQTMTVGPSTSVPYHTDMTGQGDGTIMDHSNLTGQTAQQDAAVWTTQQGQYYNSGQYYTQAWPQ